MRKLLLLFVILSPSLGLAQSQQFFHYPAEETANTFTNTNQFEVGIVPGPVVFGSLPSPPLLGAGTIIFCSNCTLPSNPCTAGGTGAFAIYMNGAWNCSFGGGGGGGSGTVQQIQTGPGLTGGPITVTGTISLSVPVSAANGGTGLNTGSSTGVATLASGTWNISSALAASLGGTGLNTSSSTGIPQIAAGIWSVGTTLPSGLTLPSATLSGALTTVPSGATMTILSGGSLICAAGSTCPSGTGTVTSVASGNGLTGGPITGTGTLSLVVPVTNANGGTGLNTSSSTGVLQVASGTSSVSTALANGTTATTQTTGDTSGDVATDLFVSQNSSKLSGLTAAWPVVAISATGVDVASIYVDGSNGYVSGNEICGTIINNLANAPSSNGIILDLGGFASFFTGGVVPCNLNPLHNQGTLNGVIMLGPMKIVTSRAWVTPGNGRFSIIGTGTSNPGPSTAAVANSTLSDCTAKQTGWNGTACVIGGVTVPTLANGGGDSLTFSFPHGAFGCPSASYPCTKYPLLWDGGQGNSSTACAGSFGHVIKDITLDAAGAGGADFNYYNCGGQEDSALVNVVSREVNSAGRFFDGAVTLTSGAPTHMRDTGGEIRMDSGNTAAQGYPNASNEVGMGYGIWAERGGDVVWFSGSNCTVYPQGYDSLTAGNPTGFTLLYPGTCTAAPTCHINSVQGGAGATCTATYSGGAVTGVTFSGGNGNYIGAPGGPNFYNMGEMTITGTGPSGPYAEEGVVLDGGYNGDVHDVHCESILGYCVHDGAGNGSVTGGTIRNIDVGVAAAGVLHIGNGADSNQTISQLQAVGNITGSAYTLLDDANSFTWSKLKALPFYQPGGQVIPNSLLDANGNPFLASSNTANAVNSVTITNSATGNPVAVGSTGSDTNIQLNLTAKGSAAVNVPGTGGLTVPNGGVSTGSTSLTATACPSGVTGAWCAAEGSTAGTPTSGVDYLRADSVNHCLEYSKNGGAETCVGLGAVTSVSNSDSTLTISPTTGAVVASLNLAHANTWTATQTFAPTSTTQVPAIFNLPSGSTASYAAEFQNNAANVVAFNPSGEAFFGSGASSLTAGTAGGSYAGEGTAFTGTSGVDGWYSNAANHCFDVVNGATDEGCALNASSTVVSNFTAHQFWGNNTGSTAAPVASLIGTSDWSPNAYVAGGGTAQAQTATFTPAVTALTAGLEVFWKPTAANTAAAPTLAVNGLAAKSITKLGTTALVANDLTTTAIADAIYDGTEWQLQNPQTSTGGGVTSVNTLTGAVVVEAAAAGQVAISGGNAAALTGAADLTYATHTFSAISTTIFDLSAATGTAAFKVPTNATNTATAAGAIDFDTTNKNFHGYVNGADSIFANFASAPTTNVIPKAVIASGNTLLANSTITDNGTIVSTTEGLQLGSANCTAFGTAGGLCAAEGTSATNVASTSNLYPDSTSHEWKAATNGSTSYGTMVRAQPGAIRSTGLVAAVTTATLCAASAGACNVAGTYHVHVAIYQSGTTCSANATGGVGFNITWTDGNGTAHTTSTVPLIAGGSAVNASNTAFVATMFWGATTLGAFASGDLNIDTNGSIIQYATTFAQCGTGTATYALSAVVTRLQ